MYRQQISSHIDSISHNNMTHIVQNTMPMEQRQRQPPQPSQEEISEQQEMKAYITTQKNAADKRTAVLKRAYDENRSAISKKVAKSKKTAA